MKASDIIVLSVSIAVSSLTAEGYHQPLHYISLSSSKIQNQQTTPRKYPSLKEAINRLLAFEGDPSEEMYKPIVCSAQETGIGDHYKQSLLNTGGEVFYAGEKYIITIEPGSIGNWVVINTLNIWDSKTLQYIKSLAFVVPRDGKYISYDERNHRFCVSMSESHAYIASFAYDIETDELEHFAFGVEDEEEYEQGEKNHARFKKSIFKNFKPLDLLSNGQRHAPVNELARYIDTKKIDIISRMDFNTLELIPAKAVDKDFNISVSDIEGAPANLKFDANDTGGEAFGFRLLYPSRFDNFRECYHHQNFKNWGVRIYDIKKKKLLPLSPGFENFEMELRLYGGESNCDKWSYIAAKVNFFHGEMIDWSAPELYNESTGQWEVITFNGKCAASPEYEQKRKTAYDIKADLPPVGLGSRLNVWNSHPEDSNLTYWIAACDGFCGLYLMNESTKTGKLIQQWKGSWTTHPKPVWLEDRKWLCIPTGTYGWEVYEITDARQVTEKKFDILVGSNDTWAILLPNGCYAGSPGCESLFTRFTEEGEQDMKTLSLWYNRPAEVLAHIGGNEEDIEVLNSTTRRWLNKKGLQSDAMPPVPTPIDFAKVEIESQDLRTENTHITFSATLTAGCKKALTGLTVRVNGAEIPQEWSHRLLVHPNNTQDVSVTIPLESGQNFIELTPTDSMGLDGKAVSFRIVKTTKSPSRLYVVTLGVSDYDRDDLDLQFAAKDAKDLAKAFEDYGKGEVHTLTLTDKAVKDDGVLKDVQDFLANTTVDDCVVLYLAGHGMLDDQLNYYYAPASFDPENINTSGISMDDLVELLQKAKAHERVLLLDTCHSGVLGEEGEDKLAASGVQLPHGVRAVQNRGMKVKKATSKLTGSQHQRKRFIEELFIGNSQYRGVNIIAGAAGAEYALESDKWSNGVFTAALIQLLQNFATVDENHDGILSLRELLTGVQAKVHHLTAGAQKPNFVAAETPTTELGIAISSLVVHKDWDTLCQRIRRISDKRELTLILDSFLMMNSAGITVTTADEIEQKIKELENKRHSYSEEEKEYLRAAANVIFKFLEHTESYSVRIPYKVWACAVEVGLEPRALLQYQDVWEYDHRTALKQLAEGKKATSSANSGELAKLQTLIGYLRETNYSDRTYQLYQRRLLAVLPVIANGGYVDTNIDTVLANSNGTTALHNACGLGYYALVEWLLRNGANVHARATNGVTPIQCVSNDPHGQISALLRKYGAPATVTATRTNSGELAKLQTLIGYLRAANYTDRTHQLYQRRLLAVLPIIANGGYVNTNIDTVLKNSNGTTALHNACALGYQALVEWLLRNGANVHAQATNGATPEQCIGNDPFGQIRALLQQYK